MATTLEDRTQQLKVADQIITEIITGLVLRGERSLDMLQALLVYISWSVSLPTTLRYGFSHT